LSLWVLDTDHISLFQRRQPKVISRLARYKSTEIAITIITVEEQLRGRLQVIRRASAADEIIRAYENLLFTFDSLKSFNILSFNAQASQIYTNLLEQKIKIGKQDLKIAATTLSVNGIMVTRNRRDFSQIPNLVIEDTIFVVMFVEM
jgi:tRNA(fMet)-specific endonuclease VapC